jgi:hypothetical protein
MNFIKYDKLFIFLFELQSYHLVIFFNAIEFKNVMLGKITGWRFSGLSYYNIERVSCIELDLLYRVLCTPANIEGKNKRKINSKNNGRAGTRTLDPLHAKQMRYRCATRPG